MPDIWEELTGISGDDLANLSEADRAFFINTLGYYSQQDQQEREKDKNKRILILHLHNFRKVVEARKAGDDHRLLMDEKGADAIVGALGKSGDILSGAYSTLIYLMQFKKAGMPLSKYVTMIAAQGFDTRVGTIGRSGGKGKESGGAPQQNSGGFLGLGQIGTLGNAFDVLFKSNTMSARMLQEKMKTDMQQFANLLEEFGIDQGAIQTTEGIDQVIRTLEKSLSQPST